MNKVWKIYDIINVSFKFLYKMSYIRNVHVFLSFICDVYTFLYNVLSFSCFVQNISSVPNNISLCPEMHENVPKIKGRNIIVIFVCSCNVAASNISKMKIRHLKIII